MSEHARLSPSNHRWPKCPGSVREEAQYPDTSGPEAIDGTGSHLLLETCLKMGMDAKAFIGQTLGVGHHDQPMGWLVEQDRADRVQMALDYVGRRRRELAPWTVTVEAESKSDPGSAFHPPRTDWWGTCDVTIRATEEGYLRYLEVVDFKDGRGFVSAEDNTQLISYAGGKIPHSASGGAYVEGVRMTIVQPKTTPVVRYQDKTWFEVHDAAYKLYKHAADTDDPNAPLIAGDWCQWCKANPKRGGHCTKAAQQANEELKMENETGFEALLDLDVRTATEQQLAEVMDLEPSLLAIQEAMERVKAEIQARLEDERDVPGWSLQPGRMSRQWTDEEQVLEVLKKTSMKLDEFAPRKLLTPAQAEKTCSKRTFEGKLVDLIEEKPGKLKPKRVSHRTPETFPVSFA